MLAADLMTSPVLAIRRDAPLAQAIRLMTEHKVSGLPVIAESGKVVGMLTEGDLLRRVETGTEGEKPGWLAGLLLPGRQAEKYVRTHGRRVEEVMTSDVISVGEGTPAAEIVRLMQRHHVKRLPVLRDEKLVGIVGRSNVVRRVGEALSAPPVSVGDSVIQRAILDEMDTAAWSPGRMVTVSVKDGVVQLDGCLFDLSQRDALGVLAENVPGVRRVENRTVCVEPYSGMMMFCPPTSMAAGA